MKKNYSQKQLEDTIRCTYDALCVIKSKDAMLAKQGKVDSRMVALVASFDKSTLPALAGLITLQLQQMEQDGRFTKGHFRKEDGSKGGLISSSERQGIVRRFDTALRTVHGKDFPLMLKGYAPCILAERKITAKKGPIQRAMDILKKEGLDVEGVQAVTKAIRESKARAEQVQRDFEASVRETTATLDQELKADAYRAIMAKMRDAGITLDKLQEVM